MGVTDDRNDPRLGHGVDTEPIDQHEVYLVLSEEERKKGFTRPYRSSYTHTVCGVSTVMGEALSETYAVNPKFYSATYCMGCRKHLAVNEFTWNKDGAIVGS